MTDADPYVPRHLTQELQEAVASSRVVNLVGPRQVGKTTLVRDLFGTGTFITLDDPGVLAAIDADPQGQIASLVPGQGPLIIDEVQRSANLALVIKGMVDRDRRKGQFVLTGSSNVFASTDVADSLAGRMRTLKLWPLSVAEVTRAPVSHVMDWAMQTDPDLGQLPDPVALERQDYIDLILAGGFPETRNLPQRARQRQYRDYVDAVVERDVADLTPIRKPEALRILIDQMAARSGQEVNTSELAKLIKLQRITVDQYLDVLLRLSMVTKLGAWTSSEGKREIKTPKYHLVDTGIMCALRRLTDQSFAIDQNPQALGGVLETFVLNELLRALPLQDADYRLYHWRSADRREIDILIDGGQRLVCVEIKAAATVKAEDFKHIRWFTQNGPGSSRACKGIVFYLGRDKLTFGNGCFALPVSSLWANGPP